MMHLICRRIYGRLGHMIAELTARRPPVEQSKDVVNLTLSGFQMGRC
jgi:hypothetical protein